MNYKEIISRVSSDLNLPKELVNNTYISYWKFIRNSLESLPLKDSLTPEQFERLRVNINVPSLGKLNCTYKRYIGMKNRFYIIHKIKSRS